MRLRAVKAILARELLERASDGKALMLSVLFPLALVAIVGFALSPLYGGGGSSGIRMGFADEAGNEFSRALAAELEGDSLKLVRTGPDGRPLDGAAARRLVEEGKLALALVVPEGYPGAIAGLDVPPVDTRPDGTVSFDRLKWLGYWKGLAGGGARLRMYRDPGRMMEAGTAMGLVERAAYVTLFETLSNKMRESFGYRGGEGEGGEGGGGGFLEEMVSVEVEDVAGRTVKGRFDAFSHALPGYAIMFLLFAALESAAMLIRDRETGLLARILSFPVGVGDVFAGKSLAVVVTGTAQLGILFAAGSLMFGVPVWGSPGGLALMCFASAFFASALGMFVFSLSRNLQQANATAVILVLALSSLGGCWFPTAIMPGWMQSLSSLLPTNWAMSGFADLIWFGKGIDAVTGEALMLAGAGAALFASARFLSRRLPAG